MGRIMAVAGVELRIAYRNRWVLIAVGVMVVLALTLALAGALPAGNLAADRLTLTVVNLATLGNYLVPLIALLLSFDAIAGEVERGTMSLLATYPIERTELLAGKLGAHFLVLAAAIGIGFGAAGLATLFSEDGGGDWLPLLRLIGTAIMLGTGFLCIGYLVSGCARSVAGAAGYVVGVWLVGVVLYDVVVLGLVLLDDGGTVSQVVIPWLLIINPADAFRMLNLATDAMAPVSGMGAVATSVPLGFALLSLVLWPVLGFAAAAAVLRRREL